jgi:hypothetical protein
MHLAAAVAILMSCYVLPERKMEIINQNPIRVAME